MHIPGINQTTKQSDHRRLSLKSWLLCFLPFGIFTLYLMNKMISFGILIECLCIFNIYISWNEIGLFILLEATENSHKERMHACMQLTVWIMLLLPPAC